MFIFLSIIPALVWGQDSLNVRKLAQIDPEPNLLFRSPVLVDSLLFIPVEARLKIMNVANPLRPREIGSYSPGGSVVAVAVRDNLAFIGESSIGLQILDISNPSELLQIGSLQLGRPADEIVLAGDFCYYVDDYAYLSIINISDPENPQLESTTRIYARRFKLWNNYLVAAGYPSLSVYDISNPSQPALTDSFVTLGGPASLVVLGNYAIFPSGINDIHVVDLSDPYNLEQVGFATFGGGVGLLALKDSVVYATAYRSGVRIIDFSDPTQPELVGFNERFGYNSITFDGDLAVASAFDEIQIYDVSNVIEPQRISGYVPTSRIISTAINGDHLYLGDNEKGLLVADVSIPTEPIVVAKVQGVPNGTNDHYKIHLVVRDNLLYASSNRSGFMIFDITNPVDPGLVGSLPELSGIGGFDLEGNRAYVESGQLIHVIDISNPEELIDLGSVSWLGLTFDVDVSNGLVCPSTLHATYKIIDMNDPTNPQVIYESSNYHRVNASVIEGNLIYQASFYTASPAIVDITNPSNPILVGHGEEWGEMSYIEKSGSYVYLGGYDQEMRIMDVSDPTQLARVGAYDTPGYPKAFAIRDSIIYVADDPFLGVYVFSSPMSSADDRTELPTQFQLHPIYPNPFNNTANIAFDLPREVTGRLVVYDVLGRMTNTLYDGKLAAGSHQMQFNGKDLSSGTYFVRLETPTFTATQKAVLLK